MNYAKLKADMTESERRELAQIEKVAERAYRDFWIRAMYRRGYTKAQIAREAKLSEGTVRSILK